MSAAMTQTQPTTVLYNADCPVCSREIKHYARYTQAHELPVQYEELGKADTERWGLTPEQAAKRLHVRKNGQVYDGIPAFIALWQDMPRYRWLARVVSLPGMNTLAVLSYDHVMAPLLFTWHKARLARRRDKRVLAERK